MTAPILTGLAPIVTFAENTVNAAPQLLFGDVALTAPEGFAGGVLRVTGLLAEDTVSVLDDGTGAGAIGLSGADVTYGGAAIGTLSGGAGDTLSIELGAGATVAAIEALIESITFATASHTPTAERTLRLELTNAAGEVLSPSAFTALTGPEYPLTGLASGYVNAPAFADLDGDGDVDAMVGDEDGGIRTFTNDGELGFTELTGAANPQNGANVGGGSKPVFADINGDGILNLVVGANDGTLHVLAPVGTANPLSFIDVGAISAPAFGDVDGDGNTDLIVGNSAGELRLFVNDGAWAYAEVFGAANPFDSVAQSSGATPAFIDVDGDDDLDLIFGGYDGNLRTFENLGAGSFSELVGGANPLGGIAVDYYSTPSAADLDGDGDLDLVVGDYYGSFDAFGFDGDGIAIDVTVTAENDAPVVTGLPEYAEVLEDVWRTIAMDTVQLEDFDAADILSLKFDARYGTLFAYTINGSGVTVAGASTSDMTLNGTAQALTAFFDRPDALYFKSRLNDAGFFADRVGMSVNDGAGSGEIHVGITHIHIASVIDPTTFSGLRSAASFAENTVNDDPQLLFGDMTLSDPDGFGGGMLRVSGLLAEDVVSLATRFTSVGEVALSGADVTINGAVIGTLTGGVGGTLAVNFGDNVSNGQIEAVIESLTYANTIGAPTDTRTLRLDLRDGGDALIGDIDVGGVGGATSIKPSFVDLDGDGDLDAVVGASDGKIRTYRNDGAEGFAELTGADNPFADVQYSEYITMENSAPTFTDLDGDGDQDLVIQTGNTFVISYRNDGDGTYTYWGALENPLAEVRGSGFSSQSFVDYDNDGDLDVVLGGNGELISFENDGYGVYLELFGDDDPFHVVSGTPFATPSFFDLDGDGYDDLVVGDFDGKLRTFLNDGVGGFIEATGADNPFEGIDVGSASAPVFADIDGDGVTELVVGNSLSQLNTVSFNLIGHEIDVSVTPQNDAPFLANAPGAVQGVEDTNALLDLSALSVVDPDGDVVLAVQLVASEGVLHRNAALASSLGVTATGDGTGALTLTGGSGALASFFANGQAVSYRGLPDVFGDAAATLTVIVNDGGDAGDLTLAVIDIDIVGVGDDATISGLADVTFAEDTVSTAPQLLFGDVTLVEVDDLVGGVLRVTGLLAEDIVSLANGGTGAGMVGLSGGSVTWGGVAIAALSGGAGETLTINFGEGTTNDAVNAVIESLTYANLSDTPTQSRNLNLVLVDADGGVLLAPDATDAYTQLTGAANPLDGVNLGSYSNPSFADTDGDGDMDFVVGETSGELFTYMNEGAGGFVRQWGVDNPFDGLDVSQSAAPAFVDIDNDGDVDVVVGSYVYTSQTGPLHLFVNDGAGGFTEAEGAANPFDGLDFGAYSTPSFADIDNDGHMDAVIGNGNGTISVLLNDGAGSFAAGTNPFSALDYGAEISPVFVDVDHDGDQDLVLGLRSGTLEVYANDGAGGFVHQLGDANPFYGIDVDENASPAFVDLNGNGQMDLVLPDGYLNIGLSPALFFANTTGVTVNVTVTPDNDAPVAADDALMTNEDTAITGSVLAANGAGPDVDPDGDVLTVSQVNGDAGAVGAQITLASGALLTLTAPGAYDYDPNGALDALAAGETMTDSFDYTVVDLAGVSSTATVTVTVEGINHAPQPVDDAVAIFANAAITGSVLADNGAGADFDIDGDVLSVYGTGGQITLTSGALLTLSDDGTYDYDPNGAFDALGAGQVATDSFDYAIVDGVLFSDDSATVTVTITGVNDAPVAHLDLLATDADAVLAGSVLAANGNYVFEGGSLIEGHYAGEVDFDVEGDALTVVRVGNSAASVGQAVTLFSGAVLTLNGDGTFAYDPMGAFDWLTEGESASDSFAYTVSDGELRDGAVVALTITGVNDAPVLTSPAAFTVAPGDTAVGAVAATDAEGSALTYAIAGGADAALFAIDEATGALNFLVPPTGGAYDVIVAASDGAASTEQVVAVTVPSHGAAIGEVMQLTVGTSWQMLDFVNDYVDPVVFALAPTLNEADAAATRFKNVTGTGAEIRLQENKIAWDEDLGEFALNSGAHVDETMTLLVMERGVHTLEDGTVVQVGELSTNKLYVKGFETIAFAESFDTTPSIFSQVQTYNGNDFIISRQRNPDGTGFQLTMQEEQADNLNHAHETVGWLAIEHGSGALSGMDWQAGSSAQNVNGKLTNVNFGATFEEAPLVVASIASYNGTDTSSPRIGAVTASKFTAMALEDQSYDIETNHGYEIIDWMAFSQAGTIYEAAPELAFSVADPGQTVAEMGFAEALGAAVTVNFGSQFEHPVVIASLTSMANGAAAIARVFNVTEAGFDLILQTPDGSAHAAESVSWMVVEAGSWQLADGTMLQAGLTDPGAGFTSVAFDAAFDDGPAVLSQVQSMNEDAFVKTRMQGADNAGFEVALEGSEAADGGAETVGWIAVDMGLASGTDGFVFEAGEIATNQKWTAETFDAAFNAPGVVAGMASYNGTDAAAARLGAITDQGFQIRAEEDQTHDAETFHAREDFHWIAFDQGDVWGDAIA
jgi:VCBS repeat-containing protein